MKKIPITVLVDEEKHKELSQAAKKRGMSLAAFMRNASFAEAAKQ